MSAEFREVNKYGSGGQGRGRTGDLPSFSRTLNIQIGLYSHAQSVVVSCESLTVLLSDAESVHIVCT